MSKRQKDERREYARIPVKKGFVALLNLDEAPVLTKLIDISRKGLAFSYTSVRKIPDKTLELDILFPHISLETDIFLAKIEGRVISVYDLIRRTQSNMPVARRYGIEFQGLGNEHQSYLGECFEKAFPSY